MDSVGFKIFLRHTDQLVEACPLCSGYFHGGLGGDLASFL